MTPLAASGVRDALREAWRKNWPEAHAALTGGLPSFLFASSPRPLGDEIPAFCYHVVDPDAFEEDLRFLADNGYVTIDADTCLGALTGRREAPPRAVVLTIDDGARNLHDVAYPMLQSFGMTAVAFVCPGLHRHEGDFPMVEGDHADDLPCSWEQIEAMHASGVIDVQSHTLEHRYVPRWPEPAELAGCAPGPVSRMRGPARSVAEDLAHARSILEERLGKKIRHLAFPKFIGTREAVAAGKAGGYEGFWWGALPGSLFRRTRRDPDRIPRLNDEWLRRLPGKGRRRLRRILAQRARGTVGRYLGRNEPKKVNTNLQWSGAEEAS